MRATLDGAAINNIRAGYQAIKKAPQREPRGYSLRHLTASLVFQSERLCKAVLPRGIYGSSVSSSQMFSKINLMLRYIYLN